jgi:hypothetical protein
MTQDITIKAEDDRKLFVSRFEDGVWISLVNRAGHTNCIIPKDQAQVMLEALQNIILEIEELSE